VSSGHSTFTEVSGHYLRVPVLDPYRVVDVSTKRFEYCTDAVHVVPDPVVDEVDVGLRDLDIDIAGMIEDLHEQPVPSRDDAFGVQCFTPSAEVCHDPNRICLFLSRPHRRTELLPAGHVPQLATSDSTRLPLDHDIDYELGNRVLLHFDEAYVIGCVETGTLTGINAYEIAIEGTSRDGNDPTTLIPQPREVRLRAVAGHAIVGHDPIARLDAFDGDFFPSF
jgi:hypothetical protein